MAEIMPICYKINAILIDLVGNLSQEGCLAPVAENWRVQLHPF